MNKDSRTIKFFAQVKYTSLFQMLSVLLNFAIVSLSLELLGETVYGIWATLVTFFNWIFFLDLGLANGARNQLSVAHINNEHTNSKKIIATTYIIVAIIALSIIIMFLCIESFISWDRIFKNKSSEVNLRLSMIFTVITASIIFVSNVIKPLLHAFNRSSLTVLLTVFSQLFSLIFISILFLLDYQSLSSYLFIYGFSGIISAVLLTFWFFRKYKFLIPSIKDFQKALIPRLFSISSKFFLIQLAALIIFSSDKFIVIQLLGSSAVTVYDIVYKFFSIPTFISGIIMMPLWSSFTHAYEKRDHLWIEKTFKKLFLLMGVIIVICVLLVIFFPIIVKIWLINPPQYQMSFVILTAVFIVLLIWSSIFSTFVNSINQITPQLITAIITAILNIPLSIYFCKNLGWGLDGVMFATVVSTAIFGVVGPIQTIGILNKLKSSI